MRDLPVNAFVTLKWVSRLNAGVVSQREAVTVKGEISKVCIMARREKKEKKMFEHWFRILPYTKYPN